MAAPLAKIAQLPLRSVSPWDFSADGNYPVSVLQSVSNRSSEKAEEGSAFIYCWNGQKVVEQIGWRKDPKGGDKYEVVTNRVL
jgi:hypothetical protein